MRQRSFLLRLAVLQVVVIALLTVTLARPPQAKPAANRIPIGGGAPPTSA